MNSVSISVVHAQLETTQRQVAELATQLFEVRGQLHAAQSLAFALAAGHPNPRTLVDRYLLLMDHVENTVPPGLAPAFRTHMEPVLSALLQHMNDRSAQP
jgi:hypothetical protein